MVVVQLSFSTIEGNFFFFQCVCERLSSKLQVNRELKKLYSKYSDNSTGLRVMFYL